MPLVFVHGVSVRFEDPSNDPLVKARTALFRKFALETLVTDPTKSLVLNPYWGKEAAKFPWNHAGLPTESYEVFGSDDAMSGALMNVSPDAISNPDAVLCRISQTSFEAAVDAVWKLAAIDLEDELTNEFADTAFEIAAYVEANPNPTWIQSALDDNTWLTTLISEARSWTQQHEIVGNASPDQVERVLEDFGSGGLSDRLQAALATIRESAVRLGDELRRFGTRARQPLDSIFMKMRAPMHKGLATFLGDVFVYFRQREQHRQPIADIITADLNFADANKRQTGEPLIVIAHSMGGIIIYDLLTSSLSNLGIDVLVTVGSQIAVIEELKLFDSSDSTIPSASQMKVPKPKNVSRWLNVFDTTDILGFAASGVFEEVRDFAFSTGHAWAHGGYFIEPMFHRRLGVRLK
jgi:hypothetical protein